jgi:hypothetical protein
MALAQLTGHPLALVLSELDGLKAEGKVRQYGATWSWVHVQ